MMTGQQQRHNGEWRLSKSDFHFRFGRVCRSSRHVDLFNRLSPAPIQEVGLSVLFHYGMGSTTMLYFLGSTMGSTTMLYFMGSTMGSTTSLYFMAHTFCYNRVHIVHRLLCSAPPKLVCCRNIGRLEGHLPPHRNYLFPDELIEISVHLCTLH